MIQEFVALFDANREALYEDFRKNKPDSYLDVVKRVVTILSKGEDYDRPDPERITMIDHGHYQGTQVFVIGAQGYQPSTYWYVRMSYGSCSHCDTFQAVMEDWPWNDNEEVPVKCLNGLMTMALHVVQRIKQMDDAC